MSSYLISLLGQFLVTDAKSESVHFRSDKVRALLAYLIVEGDSPQHREQLMALLWPHVAERSARDSLRSALYHLRKSLPNYKDAAGIVGIIETEGQYVQLNREYGYQADVEQFLASLENAHDARGTDWQFDDQYLTLLEQAALLYKGAFLKELPIADSSAFEEWSQGQRVRFRTKMLDTLSNLATIYLHRKDFAQAESSVKRQLELDNLRESAYRQQMEILARSGRVAEALQLYNEMARLLKAELGMSPGSQSTALMEEIRGGSLVADRASQLQIRGYQLREKRGEGAFGAVYQAVQAVVGRVVGIKVIKPEYASRAEFIRRFEAEAQIVARLEHPHIVPLYDYWREPEGAYLVMRWLDGGSLEDQLDNMGADTGRFLTIVDQIAMALAYSHAHGVIHRDLKPANVLLDESGNAYLSDFGIAKDLLREVDLTQQDALIGSPAYISPEQILSEPVTPQTDIYTFGVVIFELLTGQKPFRGASMATLIYKHVNEALPLVKDLRADLPAGIDAIIQRATAKSPADRYANPLQISQELKQLFNGSGSAGVGQTLLDVDGRLIGQNPYRGLRAFQESDADLFFGRSLLVDKIIGRWRQSIIAETTVRERFLAVVGPSGSGKSSVVKAGFIPALRAGALSHSEDWFITEMVPGSHPFEELETALRRVLTDAPNDLLAPLRENDRGLIRVLRHSLPSGRDGRLGQLLLVIDQFEELFTLVEDEERRQAFIDSLVTTMRDERSQLRVIVTLRADFYDRPLGYSELGQLIQEQTEVVLPLSPTELEEAMRVPAALTGVQFEDGLIAAMIADVSEQPGALPLLQYALTELYEQRNGDLMSLESYHKIGGVFGAIGGRAEEIYSSLDLPQQQAAEQLFLRLITLGEGNQDTRRRALHSELRSVIKSQDSAGPGLYENVVDRYGQHRLITFDHDPVTRGRTIEVAHEALIREWPRLRDWLDDSRDDIRRQRRLALAAAEWEKHQEDESYLWRGANLDQFTLWAMETTLNLTPAETKFLDHGTALQKRRALEEQSRQRRELESARQLARTEKLRAEEQTRSVANLLRRSYWLAGVATFAFIAALAAAFFANRSAIDAAAAEASAGTAQANEAIAQTQQSIAQSQADLLGTAEAVAVANANALSMEVIQRTTAEADALGEAALRATAQNDAEAQSQLAYAREVASSALSALNLDPELGILLSLQSLQIQTSAEGEAALRRALADSRMIATTPLDDSLGGSPVYFTEDGNHVIVSNQHTVVVDAATGEIIQTFAAVADALVPITDTISLFTINEDRFNVQLLQRDLISGELLQMEDSDHAATGIPADIVYLESNLVSSNILAIPGDLSQLQVYDKINGGLIAAMDTSNLEIRNLTTDVGLSTIALAVWSGQINIYDADTGELRHELPAHSDALYDNGIYLNRQANLITSTYGDRALKLWDLESGAELNTFYAPILIIDIAISLDNTLLVGAGFSGEVYVWDAQSGDLLYTLQGHTQAVMDVAISPDGNRVASTSNDGTLRIWDITSGGRGERFTDFVSSGSRFAGSSVDGSILAIPRTNGLEVVNTTTRETLWFVETEMAQLRTDFSNNTRYIASASESQNVFIWDAEDGELLSVLEGHQNSNTPGGGTIEGSLGVSFSSDDLLLATSGQDGTIKIWDVPASLDSGQGVLVDEVVQVAAAILAVEFAANDSILFASLDNTAGWGDYETPVINAYSYPSGELLYTLVTGGSRNWSMALSFDGQYLATGGDDSTARVWDVATGELVSTFVGHRAELFGIAFDPTGDFLATGSANGDLKIWDVSASEVIHEWVDYGASPTGFAFAEGGRYLSVTGWFGELRSYALEIDDLRTLAERRLTRQMTEVECQRYLHRDCDREAGFTFPVWTLVLLIIPVAHFRRRN